MAPSSRTRKALRDEMLAVYRELRRIRDGADISPELEAIVSAIAAEFIGFNAANGKSDVEKEDDVIESTTRK